MAVRPIRPARNRREIRMLEFSLKPSWPVPGPPGRERYKARPIGHSAGRKVAGNTNIAEVLQSGHFWRNSGGGGIGNEGIISCRVLAYIETHAVALCSAQRGAQDLAARYTPFDVPVPVSVGPCRSFIATAAEAVTRKMASC